jgi:ABC-type transporter MlaC component
MSKYHRILFGMALIALIGPSVNSLLAQSVSPKASEPTEIVDAFYHWYLQSLTENRDPITQDRAALRKFVARTLLNEIYRRSKSPDGLDSDYFLQTQDYLDDWRSKISVARLENNGKVATTVLTLGANGSAPYRLKVTLKEEAGLWKIAKVQSFRH